jgi:hypothetical protein
MFKIIAWFFTLAAPLETKREADHFLSLKNTVIFILYPQAQYKESEIRNDGLKRVAGRVRLIGPQSTVHGPRF